VIWVLGKIYQTEKATKVKTLRTLKTEEDF